MAGPQGSFRSSLSDPGEHRRAFVRRELAYRRRFEDVSDPQSLVGPLLIRNDGDTPDQRAVMHADPRADGAGARCPSLQVLPIEDEMLHTLPIKDGIGLREVSVEILLRDGARHLHGDQNSLPFLAAARSLHSSEALARHNHWSRQQRKLLPAWLSYLSKDQALAVADTILRTFKASRPRGYRSGGADNPGRRYGSAGARWQPPVPVLLCWSALLD